jgi:signal transduction histidine kinase
MEQTTDTAMLLDLMVQPAFSVKDGLIVYANPAALSRTVAVGCPITELLVTGQDAYSTLTSGCLYLTLNISGVQIGASVTRIGDFDVFLPDEETENTELQAIALAARELRGPLTGIMSTADRLFPVAALQEDPALREQAARINRGLYQMLRIIGNMSDACHYAGASAAKLETVEITGFLQEIFDRAAELVCHAGLSLRFENLPYSFCTLANEEKLERAIMNILSNAMKFTPAGGTIDAKLSRRGNRLHLSIQDSGEGIPDSLRGNLHRRYQRQPGLEDGRFGIGLGMVLIRSAAAIHGGTVLIDHPEGAGTRITMTMEIRQDSSGNVRSPLLRIDYAGERDHSLVELSEILPHTFYEML